MVKVRYRLLKSTPTIKAGTMFKEVASDFDGAKELLRITPIGAKTNPQWTIDDIDNFDEWFEEIKYPTVSIHWKPRYNDEYFYISDYGDIYSDTWRGNHIDNERLALGFVYSSEEECEKAKERKLAKVRLQRTSTFELDFENNNSCYVVYYDFRDNKLDICSTACCSYGERVYYKTKEDAEKSIKENKRDWKIYFGIEEEI